MSLPILTTADDVRQIVNYLKTKPTGATVSTAKAVIRQQVLDKRKINAYEFWKIVSREGDRIKLTELGRQLARKPQEEAEVFKAILKSTPPYWTVLEWIHHHGLALLRGSDMVSLIHLCGFRWI